nr:uncharacterized protein LOC127294371 isoform X2 [Lolium perenne]
MAKHPSSPSASSPARKSPQPTPAGDAIDLSAAAAAAAATATTTAKSGPNASFSSSSSPPAGFVFMCSGATKPQCFSYRVLGLPRGRLGDVSRIRRGAALFLYDFDSKYLYGPYRADSDGGLDLEPAAFQGRYPAQVKFTIDGDFMPIPESSVRSAIKENYSRGKFCPELTVMQVEKLRGLFRPITVLPESAPSADYRHYVDNRHPDPSAAYVPASGSHPTQPAAYVHYPSAYVPAQAAHLVPHKPYAYPYSHLPPPSAQFTAPAYYATPAGHPYQAGYESYDPSASAYHYAQATPSCYPYVQTQHLVPQHVPRPVYSTDPYFTANRDDPYRFDAVKSHYQETTSERCVYDLPMVQHMRTCNLLGSMGIPQAAKLQHLKQLPRTWGLLGVMDLIQAVQPECSPMLMELHRRSIHMQAPQQSPRPRMLPRHRYTLPRLHQLTCDCFVSILCFFACMILLNRDSSALSV